MKKPQIQNSSIVSDKAIIGNNTKIWEFVQIRENVQIGKNCIISNGVYVDSDVVIGNNVVVHNKSCLYRNLEIQDNVFVGPCVIFTNDNNPASGHIRSLIDSKSFVGKGASIGANVTILPDIKIGKYAFIGAGSVVTKDVNNYQLVYGTPAKFIGWVCECRFKAIQLNKKTIFCQRCKKKIKVV